MSPTDKLAVIGHNGWAARSILRALASQPFEYPIRVLAREGSDTSTLPQNTESVRYSWDDETSISEAVKGIDIVLSFIGHDGIADQKKLVGHMRDAGTKLFAPSDLALPYTAEERADVQVPRDKLVLENQLNQESVPFVTICIGNMTSFALDSPYMGIDIPNNRIMFTGDSKSNQVFLCSLDYIAAGYVSIFFGHPTSSLAGRLIGLNELRPTMGDIEEMMQRKAGQPPRVAHDTVENAKVQAKAGRLDALVRKKMGDGSHGVGDDIWEVEGYQKKTLEDFILGDSLDNPRYIEPDEDTRHFLDPYFQ
ncbi:hypothetical protein Q7P37_000651 [Cladosporium fusiforme]